MNFLVDVARHLSLKYGENLSDCLLIFPNRRAGLFFTKYLAEISKKPIWAPPVYTISELMEKFSKIAPADKLTLVFELFKVFGNHRKSKENFDDFYFWGEMLLSDFDDTDKYLVEASQLFTNLKSLKEIDIQFDFLSAEQKEAIALFWKSIGEETESGHQKNFIEIWTVLHAVYIEFRKALVSEGIGYEGMIFRDVVENTDLQTDNKHIKHYIFIGFNALNKCEEKLFEKLQNRGLADFYWDYDRYYIHNKNHEAGHFIRRNIEKFPPPHDFIMDHDLLCSKDKSIEFIAVPSDVGQAKICGQLLEEMNLVETGMPDKTAVILADEHLLIPVLYSLPSKTENVNVTMGYPLKDTPVYSLVEHIIELQKNARQSPEGDCSFYYRNVLSILNHQYIRNQLQTEIQEIVADILRNNKIYISENEFKSFTLLNNIFIKTSDVSKVGEYLLNILHQIYIAIKNNNSETVEKEESESSASMLEQEYIFHLYTTINRLNEIIGSKEIPVNMDTFLRLLRQLMQNMRIPFTGEPLAGLQVMGILETRALDFENVVILSMNEGIMPASGSVSSFIPYNLRRGFGLPTVEQQDAIYGYYFYRLLQRAKNIRLVYNTQSNNVTTGEMSRFLYQLKYEGNFSLVEKNLVYDINLHDRKPICIEKSPEIMQKLEVYTKEGKNKKYFSPTAVNTYLDCSLKFYLRYIAKMAEPDEITEEIDAVTFGNLLHDSMESLYKRFEGKNITATDLDSMQKDSLQIEDAILKAFDEKYFHLAKGKKVEIKGRNILVFDIIKKYIIRLLEVDKSFSPFKVVALENQFTMNIPIQTENGTTELTIGGAIDRIDMVNGNIRIIDYKTGNIKNSFADIASLFDRNSRNRSSAVFQTILYSLLYASNNQGDNKIVPGIYWLKSLFDKQFDFQISQTVDKKSSTIDDIRPFLNEFSSELEHLFRELISMEIGFHQTENTDICRYCPYNVICERGD